MKTKNKNVCLFVLICFFTTLCAKAQLQNIDEIVRQDSLLFYQSRLNAQVLPIIPFDIGVSCDKFLRGKERLDRTLRGTSRHFFLDDTWSDFKEFNAGLASVADNSYNIENQNRWKPYKEKLYEIFENKLDSMCNEAVEKETLIFRLEKFGQSATYKPLFYKTIKSRFHDNIREYVNDLYKTSMMCNKKNLRRFLLNPTRKKLRKDAGAQFSIALKTYEYWLANHSKVSSDIIALYVYENK